MDAVRQEILRQLNSDLRGQLEFAVACETRVYPKDRKDLEERILRTMKKGLRLLREPGLANRAKYRWAAGCTLRYAKALFDIADKQEMKREKDMGMGRDSNSPSLNQHSRNRLIVSVHRLYRCHLSYRNAFPSKGLIRKLWKSEKERLEIYDPRSEEDAEFIEDCKRATCDSLWHLLCLKMKIQPPQDCFVGGQDPNVNPIVVCSSASQFAAQ